jgi:hypothetical protein
MGVYGLDSCDAGYLSMAGHSDKGSEPSDSKYRRRMFK